MAKASPIQTAMNGGEWSPLMEGQVTLDKYRRALRKSINFAGVVQGPAIRRSGTRWVAPQRVHSTRGRMIDFQFSDIDTFMLSFENATMSVVLRDGLLLRTPSAAVAGLVSLSPFVLQLAPGHGMQIGDQVVLQEFAVTTPLFQAHGLVSAVAGDNVTFASFDVPPGFALSGGEQVARVFHIPTPFTDLKLPSIKSVQSTDTVYLFEGTTRTRVLKRNSAFDWPLREFAFEDGPYLPVNDTSTTLSPTSTGNAITAFNPANASDGGNAGAGFEGSKAFDADSSSQWISNAHQSGFIQYDFGVATPLRGYSIVGRLNSAVEEHAAADFNPSSWRFLGSHDNVAFHFLDTVDGFATYKNKQSGFFRLKTEPSFRYYRLVTLECVGNGEVPSAIAELRLTPAHSQPASFITFNASSNAGVNNGAGFLSTDVGRVLRFRGSDKFWRWYTITAVNSPFQVVARQESDALPDLAGSVEWRLGIFSDTTGWPTCGFFHEDRLVIGGGARNPDLVAASAPSAYERFTPSDPDGVVADDHGWVAVLNGRKVGAVRWIQGDTRGLVVGTLNGPFLIRPADTRGVLTPANAKARPMSGRGCADIDPLQIDDRLLSIPPSRRAVHELVYDYNSEGYKSPNMSLFASHIGAKRFVRMVYAAEPHSLVWTQREDGSMAALTYNRDEEVIGWHRHFIGGDGIVEDMITMPSADASVSELWLQVRRMINGQERRYYEILQPFWDEASTLDTAWYVDCGFIYEGPPATSIQGLWKIEGATVSILADGVKVAPQVVTGGGIDLPFAASRVVIGFGYDSDGETLRPEAGAADGTAQGKTKRIHETTIRLWQTVGGQLGPPGDMQDLEYRQPGDEPGSRIEPFDGDYAVEWPDGYDTDALIAFRQPGSNPLPFNVVAIMPQIVTQDTR